MTMTEFPAAAATVAAKLRVLVLDSTSFVGARLLAALAGSDWAVPVGVTRQQLMAEPGSLDAIRSVDAVVNALSEDPQAIAEGAQRLFEAAKALPALRIVHLGSMVVYGAAVGVVDETSPLTAELGPYAAAKLAADALARACPNAVCLRPSAEYGAGSRPWSEDLGRLLLAGRLGDLGAAGEGQCNVVHVDDVVQAIVAALRSPDAAGKVYNLSQPHALTWNAYIAGYGRALGLNPVPVISPLRWRCERLLAPLLKVIEIIGRKLGLRTPPLVSPSLARLFTQTIRLDSQRAERELGMVWTPLERGLAEAAAPLREKR